MYLLGIDIGTTNWKAVLYTYKGETIARSSTPTRTHYGESGQAVYEADEIWIGVCGLLQDIIAQCKQNARVPSFSPEEIRGVAVTGMGEAVVPLDRHNRPLYPVIAWFDPRTEPQYRWLSQYDQDDKIFQITGLSHTHIYSLCKILWIREHEAGVFEKAVKWLTMPDFILFKLSGEYATDYSEAGRTMCFDITRRQWSEWILDILGIDQSFFPPAYPSGTVIGRVHTTASQETSLAVGTPVVTGGHDHICGALAVGVFREGECIDSCGTSESLVLSLNSINLPPTPKEKQLTYGCHVTRDTYYIIAGMYSAGSEFRWYKEQFEGKIHQALQETSIADTELWQHLIEEARGTPPGADGVFFLPHTKGASPPPVDPLSRGVLLGLRSHHHRGHILRAITEGLCYEARRLLTSMEEYAGVQVNNVRVVGNAQNTFWLQVKADILNKCLEVPSVTEATCLGAALLAGIGTGIYHNEVDAFQHTYRPGKIYEPTQEYVSRYDHYYQKIFQEIYPTIAPLHHKIAKAWLNTVNPAM